MDNIGIIGHVGHGRTTVISALREILEVEDKRLIVIDEAAEIPDELMMMKDAVKYAAPLKLTALPEMFIEGQKGAPITVKRETPKVSRNSQCPCGSGKKNKRCCNL